MPQHFQPKLSRMHRALAWQADGPNAAGLAIRVQAADDGIHAIVNGQDFRLSDNPQDTPSNHIRKFAAMLAHYPAPVSINDEPVATTPYRAEPGIRVSRHTGDLMNPGHTSGGYVQGHFRPTILQDHVLYELGHHSTVGRQHPDYQDADFAASDHQDGQPHFARRVIYTVTPNYQSEGVPLTARKKHRWEFTNTGGSLYVCCPPPDVMRALALSQREQQEQEAAAIIKVHTGAEPVGAPIRPNTPAEHAPVEHRSLSNGGSVPLLIYGAPAYVDLKLDQAASHTIARALYDTPTLDAVPVQNRRDLALPVISCEAVTVITGSGENLALARNHDGLKPDFTPEHSKARPWQETGCRAITAHLTVTEPNGNIHYADLPMNILCAGQVDYETVYLTNAWTPDRAEELEELLFLAYWPEQDPPEDTTERQYREQAEALAVSLLHGPTQGLMLELRQHCDNFYPLNRGLGLAAIMVANDRHSFIWQPRANDDTPVWLTAAIAGQNPELSAAAVQEHARRILNDPSQHQALCALLKP